MTVEPYWPGLFAKATAGLDLKSLVTNIGAGVGTGGGAAAAPASSAAAPAAAAGKFTFCSLKPSYSERAWKLARTRFNVSI